MSDDEKVDQVADTATDPEVDSVPDLGPEDDEDEYQESDAKSEPDDEELEDVEEEEESGEDEEVEDEEDEKEDQIKQGSAEVEAPVKRKRGRPPGSGKKKAPKSGRFQPLQVPLDENGQPYLIENDELMLPEDPKGEEKIDKLGVLKGGREFRIRTFTILGRGQRMYMLATEPARCIGFRDSYLLFQRHRNLLKVKLSDDEKFDLIERELIPHSYKGRTLGVVTARSIFREFGARVIVGGHRVVDDYNEAQALAEGHTSEELADPDDFVPYGGNQQYDKNQYVAWYSGPTQATSQAMYESNLKSVLMQQGQGALGNVGSSGNQIEDMQANILMKNKASQADQQPDPPLDDQLLSQSKLSAAEFNKRLIRQQKRLFSLSTQNQVYDHHTNVPLWPPTTQPFASSIKKVGNTNNGKVVFTTVVKTVEAPRPKATLEQN